MERTGLVPSTVGRRLAALKSVVKLARTVGRIGWTLKVPSLTTAHCYSHPLPSEVDFL
jgi:hypothetical protein